jgi:hypothetical protein
LIQEHKSSAELLEPFLRGRDVSRWGVSYADLYLIKIESSENKEHAWSGRTAREAEKIFAATYPAIHTHFQNYRKELIRRDDQGKYFWELRSCKYWREFSNPKIVSTKISIRPTFMLDTGGNYLGNTSYFLPTLSEKHYLLALLNSSLFHFYAKKIFVEKQNGWFEIQPTGLENFSIPSAEDWQKEIIEKLVDYILFLTKDDETQHKLVTDYFEAIINALVYELFLADELRAADKRFFEPLAAEILPALAEHPGEELSVIKELFDRLSARDHDIRRDLYFLNELESVRIIEGKE